MKILNLTIVYIIFISSVFAQEDCTNGIDDDLDGFIDLFDTDCICDDQAFNAYCDAPCQYVPDSFPEIVLREKWRTERLNPDNILNDVPNVIAGDIDGDGTVEILSYDFLTRSIYIYDGVTGSEERVILTDIIGGTAVPYLSMGDVDRDGDVEIFLAVDYNFGDKLVKSYSHDGLLLWSSEVLNDYYFEGIIARANISGLADFNNDGHTEVYVGNVILNAETGVVLAVGEFGLGCNRYSAIACHSLVSIACDLVGDERLELAAGNTVYEVVLNNPSGLSGNTMTAIVPDEPIFDGFTGVADFDQDGRSEVVVIATNDNDPSVTEGISLWNPRTKKVMATDSAGRGGGIPFIGDVDGDCIPEIGVTYAFEIRMYKYTGANILQEMYRIPADDPSGRTGITMFDFNQDGKMELVYRDGSSFSILNGEDGSIVTRIVFGSQTSLEYPIILDVDNDNEAEIVVMDFFHDIVCLESGGKPWAPARSVWNQTAYHVTNVNDDLTIPRYQQRHTGFFDTDSCLQITCPQVYNNYMAQATYRTQKGCTVWPVSDLAVSVLHYDCQPDSVTVYFLFDNLEGNSQIDSFYYSIYNTDPTQSGDLIFSTLILDSLAQGMISDTFSFTLANSQISGAIFISASDDGSMFTPLSFPITSLTECNYDNNIDWIEVDVELMPLDLGADMDTCIVEAIELTVDGDYVSYLWNNQSMDSSISINQAGEYSLSVVDKCGNLYTDTIIITEKIPVTITRNRSICSGDTLIFYQQVLFEEGIYTAVVGTCDSTIMLELSIIEQESTIESEVACDHYFWNGVIYTESGTYIFDTINVLGCDSILILDLEINSNYNFQTEITACDSLLWLGSTYYNTGTYSESFTTINSCDSVLMIDLEIYNSTITSEEQSACDTIIWNGQTITESGNYSFVTSSIFGCDSTVILEARIFSSKVSQDTFYICTGDSIVIAGNNYKAETDFMLELQAMNGCDSTALVSVRVTDVLSVIEMLEICAGDSILLGDTWLNEEGSYSEAFSSTSGCDSIFSYDISILPIGLFKDSLTICEGDSILLAGEYYKESGNYNFSGATTQGCDSTANIRIDLLPVNVSSIDTFVCEGDSIYIDELWYDEDAILSFHMTGSNGCDSIVNYTINFNIYENRIDTILFCEGDSLLVDGIVIIENMMLSDTFAGLNCAEIVTTKYVKNALPELELQDTVLDYAQEFLLDLPYDTDLYILSSSIGDISGNTLSIFIYEETIITVSVLNIQSGCKALASFTIQIRDQMPELYIPNIFSANGDFINDEWAIDFREFPQNETYLYDRWGNLIGHWQDVQNLIWDGTIGGRNARQGVYVYSIFYGNSQVKIGDVTLVR